MDVELRFAPGVYTLTTPAGFLKTTGSLDPRRIALVGLPTQNGGECVLRWADNVVSEPSGAGVLLSTTLTGARDLLDLDRFVIENLTLDGNFTGQTAVVGPHYREGYKSIAIKVRAKTGRIRNCIVRNFGSQGVMPWSSNLSSGVETFPILIIASDSSAVGSDWPENDALYRAAATTANLTNNKVSPRPFDFEDTIALAAVNFSSGQQLTVTSGGQHTTQRIPVTATTAHFQSIGIVGRVLPMFEYDPVYPENDQRKKLRSVLEVALDQLDYNPVTGNIKVRARVAEHRTPNPALAPTRVRQDPINVLLQFVGPTEIPGAWTDGIVYSQISVAGFSTFNIVGQAQYGGILAARV